MVVLVLCEIKETFMDYTIIVDLRYLLVAVIYILCFALILYWHGKIVKRIKNEDKE